MGNLTRNLELRQTQSGKSICNLNIALNRKIQGNDGNIREEVAFVDCVSFGKTAEVISKYFAKGKPILIEGYLKTDTWNDKTTGKQCSKLVVHVEKFEFAGSGKTERNDTSDNFNTIGDAAPF